MVLHCTLVHSPRGASPATPEELSLEVAAGTPGASVETAITAVFSTGELRVGGKPLRELTVGHPPLLDGAVLVDCGNPGARPAIWSEGTGSHSVAHALHSAAPDPTEASPLLLVVHTGPSAGLLMPLSRGRYCLGRGPADISIPDPALSRTHAVLDFSTTAIRIRDAGSANGTYVDGRRVRHALVSTTSVVHCGSSTITICFLGEVPRPGLDATDHDGGLDCAIGAAPEPVTVRRQADTVKAIPMIVAALLPLLLGVGLAVTTGMWLFLGFTVLSAVTVLVPMLAGRGQRRAFRAAVAEAARADEARRRRSAPSAGQIVAATMTLETTIATRRLGAFGGPATGKRTEDRSQSAAEFRGVPGKRRKGDDAVATSPSKSESLARGLPWLRIGTADQQANLRLEPADSAFAAPTIRRVPVTLDPAQKVTVLKGSHQAVEGLLRFLLMQWAYFDPQGNTCVVVHGCAEHLPLSARFLPGVLLTADASLAAAALTAGRGARQVLVLLAGNGFPSLAEPRQPSGRSGSSLRHGMGRNAGTLPAQPLETPLDDVESLVRSARAMGWNLVIWGPLQAVAGPDAAIVDLDTQSFAIKSEGARQSFVPDLVPPDVFDRFCRALAGRASSSGWAHAGVPDSAGLVELLSFAPEEIARRWSATRNLSGLSAVFGIGARGPLSVDLEVDGPHLLVAGTTGSGKSELLRSLVTSLSLTHSPARVNFIFVDFKGGSGLGPLKALPHCVGLLTDLGVHELHRTLTALRAEVRRREELLAAAGASDLRGYESVRRKGSPALAHLMIVIDEFRMLVDDAPESLHELMRIASIGRSLGIHLVMATQRPQGALTSDIRANVTSSVCLRVQSDMESMDIIGSPAAARIPVAAPGRAFLAKGSEKPVEFQAASLSIGGTLEGGSAVRVRTALDAVSRGSACEPEQDQQLPQPAPQIMGPVVATLSSLWSGLRGTAPHRPVPEPLPRHLTLGDALPEPARAIQGEDYPAGNDQVVLGLADLPHRQQRVAVRWSPIRHGNLGLVGAPASTGPLCLAVAASLAQSSSESHLYILDADGSFADAHCVDRVGAVAGPHELLRAVRILQRLGQELSRRVAVRAGSRLKEDNPKGSRRDQTSTDGPGTGAVRLVLIINGWGTWLSAFRSGPLAWAEDLVHDLVRDGGRAGLTVLITGDRELAASRVSGALPNRVYLVHGSSEESRIAWPARLPIVESLPARGVVLGPVLEADIPSAAQFLLPPEGKPWPYAATAPATASPFRVKPLPSRVSASKLRESIVQRGRPDPPTGDSTPLRILLGVGGDELEPVHIRIQPSDVLLALGSSGSGKSSLVAALQESNPDVPWLAADPNEDRDSFFASAVRRLSAERSKGAVLLVDDADLLSTSAQQHLVSLACLCRAIVLTAAFGPSLLQRMPVLVGARGSGTGLLLCPRSSLDGEFFGVRYDVEEAPPPGRAVVIEAGTSRAVQVAAPSALFANDATASHPVATARGVNRRSETQRQ